MLSKSCSKCGEDKPLAEYHRDKRSKDGHYQQCKKCKQKYFGSTSFKASKKAYNQSPKGIATRMWHHIKDRLSGKSYNGIKLGMEQSQFIEWAVPEIELFMNNSNETPSLDRIDPDGNYSLDNLRIISIKENITRSRFLSAVNGVNAESSRQDKLDYISKIIGYTCENLKIQLSPEEIVLLLD